MTETCEFCKEPYAQKIDSPPLLPCEVCGQDVHPKCLASKLGLDVANTSAEDIRKVVNPFDLPGWTYLCKSCTEDSIPTDNDLLKKSVVKAAKNEQTHKKAPNADTVPSSSQATTSRGVSPERLHLESDTITETQSPSHDEIDTVLESHIPAESGIETATLNEPADIVQVPDGPTKSNPSHTPNPVFPPSHPKIISKSVS